MPAPILQLDQIDKAFGANVVLSQVSFDVHRGEVHVLMGENGAGKSTLMNIIAGVHRPDHGKIHYLGREFSHFHSPAHALKEGIGLIHQELCLSREHSVWQNVLMGREAHRGGFLSRRAIQAECAELLQRVGAHCSLNDKVATLSTAEQQLVEIARALRPNTQVLIMDEPTASLSEVEATKIMELIHRLKALNLAIIYISHRIKEFALIADRVSVLRDGKLVKTLPQSEADPETIVSLMVGRSLQNFYVHAPSMPKQKRQPVLRVEGLSDGQKVSNVSFAVHRGQLTIIAGLVGAGRTEMARLIAGVSTVTAGQMWLNGQGFQPHSVRAAQKMGVSYVPEDRKEQGLFLEMNCALNIVFNRQGQLAHWGWRDFRAERRLVEQSQKKFSIRMAHAKLRASSLSGGNQQKLLISRNCLLSPKLLILDEPTRGVDIGARQEIYRVLADLICQGTSVVVISSDLMEVIGLRARVLVMHEGTLVAELPGEERLLSEEEIMTYATGLKKMTKGQER